MNSRPKLVAIVGGSGSGKTWIAEYLRRRLGKETGLISLDHFYLDRPALSVERRARINFDRPEAIDWRLFERTLHACLAGRPAQVPQYDYATHSRLPEWITFRPRPIVLTEGLWLLRRRSVRPLFSLSIFLECPESLRLQRRLQRDVAERGRTEESVRQQFSRSVVPMHNRFVAPQRAHAGLVLDAPVTLAMAESLAERIRALLEETV